MPGSQDNIYLASNKGALKLKGVHDSGLKKKKKKKSSKAAADAMDNMTVSNNSSSGGSVAGYTAQRTKAELHFMERQRLREEDRIQKKACKSHKEKVEEFNSNLDSQSEHFDIPKVSWTK